MRQNNGVRLFDDFSELYEKDRKQRSWVSKFFRSKHIWQNYSYLSSCISGSTTDNFHNMALFGKKVRDYYNKYCVDDNKYTQEELRNAITVMICNGIYLTSDNIEKTVRHIQQGFYRECLEEVEEKIKKEEEDREIKDLADSIDWGDF